MFTCFKKATYRVQSKTSNKENELSTNDGSSSRQDPTKENICSIIKDFSSTTSTHGIPGIARSQSIHNRMFWTISFLVFAGIMIYFLIQSFLTFLKYPTQTSVSLFVDRSQDFPAVTICNQGIIRFDLGIDEYFNFTNALNLTNVTNSSTLDFKDYLYFREYATYLINSGRFIEDYTFKLDIMLIKCVYNGQSCTHNDFISFTSQYYGLCYTFNAKLKNESQGKVRKTNENAANGYLQLQLYVHGHLYPPYLLEGKSITGIFFQIIRFSK